MRKSENKIIPFQILRASTFLQLEAFDKLRRIYLKSLEDEEVDDSADSKYTNIAWNHYTSQKYYSHI